MEIIHEALTFKYLFELVESGAIPATSFPVSFHTDEDWYHRDQDTGDDQREDAESGRDQTISS